MPSALHETLVYLFRVLPEMAARVLADFLHVSIPTFAEADLEETDFTQLVSPQYGADLVIILRSKRKKNPVFGIIVEVQLARDKHKRYTWPLYAAALRARFHCPTCVLVVTRKPYVAEWAGQPIPLGAGSVFVPVVLRPKAVPVIRDPAEVSRMPYLAILSCLIHGNEPEGLDMLVAVTGYLVQRDDPEARFVYDLIWSVLNEAVRKALEELMRTKNYEYQSEFARKYVAQGREEGEARGKAGAVLRILAVRGFSIPEAIRKGVLACRDLEQLDRWLTAAVTAASLEDVFPA